MISPWSTATDTAAALKPHSLLPYVMNYASTARGLEVEVRRELSNTGDEAFRLELTAEKFLYGYRESTIFSVQNDDIVPLDYIYRGSGLNKRKTTIQFNWAELSANTRYKDKRYTLDLRAGMQDRLSWQEHLRLQLLAGTTPDSPLLNTITLLDGKREKPYQLQFVGRENIDTPAGQFRALRFTRRGRKEGHDLNFWLACDWDYLLLKASQSDPDEGVVSAELVSGSLDGKPLLGL